MKRCTRTITPVVIFALFFIPTSVCAEFIREFNVEFAGEKKMVFISPKKDKEKEWDVKLLNQSAGRIFFHFVGKPSSGGKTKNEIGLIGYFGVAEGPGKGKYFVDSSDHIELTKLEEIKDFYYEFEGTTNQGLIVKGYLKVNSKDLPSEWQFEIKALTPDGIVFYEIAEVESDWAKQIIEANPRISFGSVSKGD